MTARLSSLALLLAPLLTAAPAGEPSPYLAIGISAWRVAAADLLSGQSLLRL